MARWELSVVGSNLFPLTTFLCVRSQTGPTCMHMISRYHSWESTSLAGEGQRAILLVRGMLYVHGPGTERGSYPVIGRFGCPNLHHPFSCKPLGGYHRACMLLPSAPSLSIISTTPRKNLDIVSVSVTKGGQSRSS